MLTDWKSAASAWWSAWLRGLIALRMYLPMAFDGMLSPMGRRERRCATLAVAIVVSLLVVAMAGLVATCTWIFSLFLSRHEGAIYAGTAPWSIVLPCLLVPWALGWRLFEYTRPKTGNLIRATVLASFGAMWILYVTEIPWARSVEMVLLAVALAGGWLLLLMALRLSHRAGDLL